MTPSRTLAVRSVAFWSERAPDWALLRAVCRGEGRPLDVPQRVPPSARLSAAERRRAPDSVRLALIVAERAADLGGIDAATTASVFASPHGDLGITHAMCETLARDPNGMSPTRFIHSVHNAVSGHWGIAQRCVRPSTSIAAGRSSFAVGLLEAATQVACSGEPVLLVAYETQPVGATARLTGTVGQMAVGVVLAPCVPSMTGPRSLPFLAKDESGESPPKLRWHVAEAAVSPASIASALPRALDHLASNHLADALVWLHDLAHADATPRAVLALPLSAALDGGASLRIEWLS